MARVNLQAVLARHDQEMAARDEWDCKRIAELQRVRVENIRLHDEIKRCDAAYDERTAELSTLRAAVQQIEPYVQHKAGCAVLDHTRPSRLAMDEYKSCTCGLADALARLSEAGQ